jgi:hypothetical protein
MWEFLLGKNHPLATKYYDSKQMLKVGCLTNIFSKDNDLNISIKGHDQTMVLLSERIPEFNGKMKL